jgi:NhaP-type Na+/H+ or K+/H+ antiporter
MQDESKTALFLESALSDVLCIVALFALLGAYRLGEVRVGLLIGNMIAAFMLASVIGILSAAAWSILLNRVRTIQNSIFTTPAFVFIIFGATELLGYNGAISSLAFGVTLGNIRLLRMGFLRKYIHMEPIGLNQTEKVFFSEAVFLLKTFFFVYIGLSIRLTEWWLVSLGSILALLLFAARIPVVRLSVQRATPMKDAALMAVMVPKGLAAAVLAAVPLQENVLGGEMIQHVTYAVILASVLLTSILIFLLERTPLIGVYGLFFSGFGAPQQEAPKSAAPAPPPFGHRIKNLWRRNPE